jgi:hypothetical protein
VVDGPGGPKPILDLLADPFTVADLEAGGSDTS